MKIDTLLSYVSQILNVLPCLFQQEQSTITHSTGTLQEELINMIQKFKITHTESSDEHIESIRTFINSWEVSITQQTASYFKILYLALTQLCETLTTEYTNTLPIPELPKELTWQAPKYNDTNMNLGSEFRYLPANDVNIDKIVKTAQKSAKY